MRRYLFTALIASSFAMPLVVGCDKELQKSETVKTNSDGTQVKESKTVKETPDGKIVTEHSKDVDRPANP